MGSFVGKLSPRPRPPALGAEVPPGGPLCPQPAAGSCHSPPATPASACGGTHRPAYRSPGTLQQRFVRSSWRRNPGILQTLWSYLGALTSVRCPRPQRRQGLSAHHSKVPGRAVSVGRKLILSVVQEQAVASVLPTAPQGAQDSGAEKAVRSAIGESGKGMEKQEEELPVLEAQDHQRRGPDGTGRAQSAFRPLGVHGGESSFLPRPGPLKRSLHSESSEDNSIKTSQNLFLSSCTKRNAITSSYSSTQGFPPQKRRRGPATSQSQLPCRSTEGVSQKTREPRTSDLARKIQTEEVSGVNSGQKHNLSDCSPTYDSSRPRKRRIPLLRPRRGEPLVLPPFPQPGYRVTADDMDQEKRAALQRINIALRDEMEAKSGCSAPQRSGASALPPPAAALPPPSLSHQQETWRRKQDSLGTVAVLEPAGVATPSHPMCGRKPSSSDPLFSSLPPLLPPTLSHLLPSAPFTLLAPAPTPLSDTHKTDLSSGPPIPSVPAPTLPGLDSKMGSPPPHLPAPVAALPTARSTVRMESPTPMAVDDSSVSILGTPSPTRGHSAPVSQGLTVTGFSLSATSSASTSASLVPQPVSEVGVTPMDISLPSQTLLQGSPMDTSSPIPSAQTMQTLPSGSTASATDTNRILAAPGPASGSSSTPGQPALNTITGSALGGSRPTTSTLGTHVTTQLASGVPPALFTSGATATSGATTSMPGTVTNGRPKGRQHRSPGASTTPGRSKLKFSATPTGFGSRDTGSDLSSKFAALSFGAGTSEATSTPHHNKRSVVLNTRGFASQRTPSMKIGPSKTKKNPVIGGTTAPTISQNARKLPRQSPFIAGGEPDTPESKASSRSMTVPAFSQSTRASGKPKAKKSLVYMAPSSPAQSFAGHRNSRPSTSSFSSGSGSRKLGSKRK